ncbi:DedA family protein [Plasticicumulans sp.]|uniref:DedA family protein n=1 Tax=Plasticicumulans sp. TaxID=2307179 RepID=UPI002CF0811B|nr:DedA family protein [Plasticicumulans sp.]MBS0599809.1 DedA family protein [Pseudomonadota bacterium]HMV39162.1 DedA family protein [Plasticicumulans sp.]HMW29133.1 DedA family protein [Plasticicumulans sp.]HMW43088.1 DedA family protein [Plasticicumulans sp.]HMZ09977.1 DedA family protein [Plasticicumulans sp.]
MELLAQFLDIVLHLDKHLAILAADYGPWLYAILFAIIFCETGLVVTPFLPGDSLLFATGALAAGGALDVHAVFLLLMLASFLGDNTNYWIGHFLGEKVFRPDARVLKTAYLDKTHAFYEKHGGKTVLLARFAPIVRTFAPFVAGAGSMEYRRFTGFCALGALCWVGSFVYAGYLFGNIPVVKNNFTLVILGIIVVSLLPGVIEYVKHRRATAAGT